MQKLNKISALLYEVAQCDGGLPPADYRLGVANRFWSVVKNMLTEKQIEFILNGITVEDKFVLCTGDRTNCTRSLCSCCEHNDGVSSVCSILREIETMMDQEPTNFCRLLEPLLDGWDDGSHPVIAELERLRTDSSLSDEERQTIVVVFVETIWNDFFPFAE